MLSCLSGDPKYPKHNSPLLSPSQFFFSSFLLSRLSSRSRYDTNLLEATGLRETSPTLAIHDVKLLLLRFADLQSFSEDTGGGGRESNLRLISYQIHAILYVLTTYVLLSLSPFRIFISFFLSVEVDKWNEKRNSCRTFLPDQTWRTTNHSTSMDPSFSPHSPWSWWNPSIGTNIESCAYKNFFSLPISDPSHHQPIEPSMSFSSTNNQRHQSLCRATAKTLKLFATYRTATIFFGLINAFFTHLFKPVCLHLCSTAIYIDLFYCLACGHDIESTLSSTVDSFPSQQ